MAAADLGTVQLSTASATTLLGQLATGTVTSVELLEALLDRVQRHNPALNAVVATDVAGARAQATAADAARARGDRLGPLHGLPMTVKDTFETTGLVTTAGATELAEYVPKRDAEAVARLRAAGAIVFGKTNVPRYAGDFQTTNDVYGTTRNPWDLRRTPGGSSGGSAAALAAGLSPLELGSDIAGSIRCPSHFCGVSGHLPTWGAVPARGHIPGAPGSLAVPPLGAVGPMARSVADLRLALKVLVGTDLAGVPGGTLPAPAIEEDRLAGLRVAVWPDNPVLRTDPDILSAFEEMVALLVAEGAQLVRRVRPPRPFYEIYQTYARLLLAVLSTSFPEEVFHKLRRIARYACRQDRRPAVQLARAVTLSFREWQELAETTAAITAAWKRVFDSVDVVITPTAPLPAFEHLPEGTSLNRQLPVHGRQVPYLAQMVWAALANLSGLPATAIPLPTTVAGLPVGVQVIAPQWHDRTSLAVAGLLERCFGGFTPPAGY